MTRLGDRAGNHRGGRIRGALSAALATLLAACGGGGTTGPPPPPGGPVTLDLAVGGSQLLTSASQLRSFGIAGGDGPREYRVIVQHTRGNHGASESMRFRVVADQAAASISDASRVRTSLEQMPTGPDLVSRRQNALFLEDRLRQSTRREAQRLGAQPARPRDPGARFSVVSAPLTVGQSVTFKHGVTVDLQANCGSTQTIDSQIRWVGDNFAIAEDVQIAGHLTDADFAGIGQLLDDEIFPLETAYFGNPADLDGNGVVIALMTAEVNRSTPRNAGYQVGGYFWSGDLLDATQCPASNEGELFYLIGPDPGGVYSDPVSADEAIETGRQVVSHEFSHLLRDEQRKTIGGGGSLADEDVWLDEGLAHLAEELVGLRVVGLPVRANLDLDALSQGGSAAARDAFNDFHLANLQRAARFMLDPEGTQALGTATAGADPPGTATLKMRGFAYLFARWLGDRYGPAGSGALPGSGEEALFRELGTGGPSFLSGPENVERAIQVVGGGSASWNDILSDFLAMLDVDDAGVAGLDPAYSSLTWDYPGLFLQLSQTGFVDSGGNPVPPPSELQNPYPLIPDFISVNASTNVTRSFQAYPSTGAFFTLSASAAAPDLTVEVTDGGGGTLDDSLEAQVLVIRTR